MSIRLLRLYALHLSAIIGLLISGTVGFAASNSCSDLFYHEKSSHFDVVEVKTVFSKLISNWQQMETFTLDDMHRKAFQKNERKITAFFTEQPETPHAETLRKRLAVLTLDNMQKEFFKRNAQNLISASLKYSEGHETPYIETLRKRLREMNRIAEDLFNITQPAIMYVQGMNYFAQLIRLADLMAYQIEGTEFSGFFTKDEPFHSEVNAKPQRSILIDDFKGDQKLDNMWWNTNRGGFHSAPRGLFIPVFGEISVIDFNRLVGSGIFPVGLVEKTVLADGVKLGPFRFATHDLRHASFNMPGILSAQNQMVWDRLLEWADSANSTTRLARHAVLYRLSHETIFFETQLFANEKPMSSIEEVLAQPSSYDYKSIFSTTYKSMKAEDYWGLHELKSVEDCETLILTQIEEFKKIYKIIVENLE